MARVNLLVPTRQPSHDAVALQAGGIVNGAQENVNTVTLFEGHGLAAGDKFLYALDEIKIWLRRAFTVSSVSGNDVTFDDAAFSFPDKAILINLEADSGAALQRDGSYSMPLWDGSTVNVYDEPSETTALTNSVISTEPAGDICFWTDQTHFWVVIRDAGGLPTKVIVDAVGGH